MCPLKLCNFSLIFLQNHLKLYKPKNSLHLQATLDGKVKFVLITTAKMYVESNLTRQVGNWEIVMDLIPPIHQSSRLPEEHFHTWYIELINGLFIGKYG